MKHLSRRAFAVCALALVLALAACDGGGSADGATDADAGPTAGDTVQPRDDASNPPGDTANPPGDTVNDPDDVAAPTDEVGGEDVAEPPEDVVPVADEVTGEDTDTAADVDPNAMPPHRREPFEGATGALEAGVAVGYLDGPVGTSMAGYGGRMDGVHTDWSNMLKGTRGFLNGQSVKAIALEIDGELAVILKTPLMSGETSVTFGTLRRLKELYGLELDGRVILTATHSHHATARYWRLPTVFGLIGTDVIDDEVLERMCTTFAETVKAAIDDLGPAEYGVAFAEDWDPDDEVYEDRRGENDPLWGKDPRLGLVAVRRPDGTPLATVINFGMHGTALDKSNDLFCEDAGGAVERMFEDYFYAREGAPIFGLFVQSGGGDARPTGHGLHNASPVQRLEVLGRIAAERIYDLYQTITWRSEATLAVRSRFIDLRYDWIGYDENDEFRGPGDAPYEWGALQCQGPEVEGETTLGQEKQCSDIENLLGMLGIEMPFEPLHQTYLSVLRLGDTFMVTLPGEPTWSVVEYMRDRFAETAADEDMDVLCFGYSQDHLLYMTSYDDWFYGGFESTSTVWGPLEGNYLVDRQMELVDDILSGMARPAYYAEFDRLLDEPVAFEPRPHEASATPGVVTEDVEATYGRGRTVRFAWSGGDPAIHSPYVYLEREVGGGGWEPVPSPAGWAGYHYDNLRHYMVTVYEPDPPASSSILDERLHQWSVAWEIPIDFPAGNYRLTATGPYWDGDALQDYTVHSGTLAVTAPDTATLSAAFGGDGTLTFTIRQEAIPVVDDGHVVSAGFRVFDHQAMAGDPLTIRAPVTISFSVGGEPQAGSWDVAWDADAAAYVFDYGQTGFALADVTLTAHLKDDVTPADMSAAVRMETSGK